MKTGRILLVCGLAAATAASLGAAPASAEADAAARAVATVARVTNTPAAVSDTPARLEEGIAIGREKNLRVRLGDGKAANRRVVDRRAVYADSDRQASSVVQEDGNATQILTVIEGSSAPKAYTFDFDLSADMRLVPAADGSVYIEQSGVNLGLIDAPWAVDAKGAAVPTRYEVRGSRLIQHVNHEGASYPVTADPRVTFGWFVYVTFNRSETTTIARHSDFNGLVASACGLIPFPPGAVGCGLIVGTLAIQTANTFKDAASQTNKCAQMRWFWTPPLWGGYAGASVVRC